MVLDSIASKMAVVSLSAESDVLDLSSLVVVPSAPPSLAARVLASRMAQLEHLRMALQAAWRDIRFTVRLGYG